MSNADNKKPNRFHFGINKNKEIVSSTLGINQAMKVLNPEIKGDWDNEKTNKL